MTVWQTTGGCQTCKDVRNVKLLQRHSAPLQHRQVLHWFTLCTSRWKISAYLSEYRYTYLTQGRLAEKRWTWQKPLSGLGGPGNLHRPEVKAWTADLGPEARSVACAAADSEATHTQVLPAAPRTAFPRWGKHRQSHLACSAQTKKELERS